jgi:cysteine desulfurase/selenocysteine lyase
VASFTLEGVHPHDVAQILDRSGVAVRAGHHCAQPLHEKFGIPATTRASFYIYSDKSEVDKLVEGIYQVKKIFG